MASDFLVRRLPPPPRYGLLPPDRSRHEIGSCQWLSFQAELRQRPFDRQYVALADAGYSRKINSMSIIPKSRLVLSAAFSLPKSLARSEEHTSELQSLMRISYAVFCLKQKIHNTQKHKHTRKTMMTRKNRLYN